MKARVKPGQSIQVIEGGNRITKTEGMVIDVPDVWLKSFGDKLEEVDQTLDEKHADAEAAEQAAAAKATATKRRRRTTPKGAGVAKT